MCKAWSKSVTSISIANGRTKLPIWEMWAGIDQLSTQQYK